MSTKHTIPNAFGLVFIQVPTVCTDVNYKQTPRHFVYSIYWSDIQKCHFNVCYKQNGTVFVNKARHSNCSPFTTLYYLCMCKLEAILDCWKEMQHLTKGTLFLLIYCTRLGIQNFRVFYTIFQNISIHIHIRAMCSYVKKLLKKAIFQWNNYMYLFKNHHVMS